MFLIVAVPPAVPPTARRSITHSESRNTSAALQGPSQVIGGPIRPTCSLMQRIMKHAGNLTGSRRFTHHDQRSLTLKAS